MQGDSAEDAAPPPLKRNAARRGRRLDNEGEGCLRSRCAKRKPKPSITVLVKVVVVVGRYRITDAVVAWARKRSSLWRMEYAFIRTDRYSGDES
jgi:hypothetical protein